MANIAIYPGTFDPVTFGHLDIVARAVNLFDEVIVAVAASVGKSPCLSLEKRIALLEVVVPAGVRVLPMSGLLVDFANAHAASVVVRGLRGSGDLPHESQLAQTNQVLAPALETVYFIAQPQHQMISSTIVREIARMGGDISAFVPPPVIDALREN